MRILFLLGWRNLARRKWRTLATCFMLFIGTLLLVFMTGLAEGTYGAMIRVGTRVMHGDFQVLHSDYNEKPGMFKNISDYESIAKKLAADGRVSGVSLRVEAPGLLSYENNTMGGLLLGIQPDREISAFMNTMSQGDWWQDIGDNIPVVLGKGIAARLKVELGDEITYVGGGADGSIAAELFTVVGITDSGVPEMDRMIGFIPLSIAQELLVMEGRVHRIIGEVHDSKDLRSFVIDNVLSDPISLQGWETLMPQLATTIEKDRQGAIVFLVIIMLVVLISVANTMMMSVMERTHELGVIQALGTSPFMTTQIVLAEIFFLALLGMIPAIVIGMILNGMYATEGIPMGMDDFSYGGVTLGNMYTINTIAGNLYYPLVVLAGALFAGLIPALRAARLKPVDAMRD